MPASGVSRLLTTVNSTSSEKCGPVASILDVLRAPKLSILNRKRKVLSNRSRSDKLNADTRLPRAQHQRSLNNYVELCFIIIIVNVIPLCHFCNDNSTSPLKISMSYINKLLISTIRRKISFKEIERLNDKIYGHLYIKRRTLKSGRIIYSSLMLGPEFESERTTTM